MDFTNIKCISDRCKAADITMSGAGAQFGPRLGIVKLKCPECGLVLMVIPMKPELKYEISATPHDERVEKRIQAAREKSELALAKEITRIKETGY